MTSNKYSSPMDLIGVYLSPDIGVGQKLNIEKIRDRLSEMPLIPALNALAQIAYRADKATNEQESVELANALLRPVYATKAVALINSGGKARHFVVSSQVITGLAINALVYCQELEYEGEYDVQALVYDLGDLLLALGATTSDELSPDTVIMELVRLDLWARVFDHDRWYELAQRMIFEVLPALRKSPDWIDTAQMVKDATGIELGLFWALTNSMAIHVDNMPDNHRFPHYLDNGHIDNAIVDRWAQFWTIELDEARELAKEDVKDAHLWSFSAFYEYPLLHLHGDSTFVIRPWFLAMKATPIGFFSAIERIIRETAKDDDDRKHIFLKWSRLFGEATELMGRTLIDEYAASLPRIDEDEIKTKWTGKGKVCDVVFTGDDWVALDFVYRRIKKETATTGDINDLAIDLERGVVEKLSQIDNTLVRGLAADGEPSGSIYPLVVVGAPFSVNGLLLNEVDKQATTSGLKVIAENKKCKPPLIIDMAEFWLLLETAEYNKLTPAQLIEMWLQSPLRVSGFRNWLVTSGPKQAPIKGDRRYKQHALKHLFGRTL
jgi:hypothetical protein